MKKLNLFVLICFACLLPVTGFAYGHYTIYSGVPADVYIDNEYSSTILASQSVKLILSGPKTYVIGVRAQKTGKTYKESVTVGADLNERREIHAFSPLKQMKSEVTIYSKLPAGVYVDNIFNSNVDLNNPLALYLPGPQTYIFEIRALDSNLVYRESVAVAPKSGLAYEIRAFSGDLPAATVVAEPSGTEAAGVAQGTISREEMDIAIREATAKAKAEALAEEAARRDRAGKRIITNKGIAHVVGVEANKGIPSSVKNMERIKLLIEAIPALK